MIKFGFDFGTTNSVVTTFDPEQETQFQFETLLGLDGSPLPSAIALRKGEFLFGEEARALAAAANYEESSQAILDPKRLIGSGRINIGGKEINAVELVAMYLSHAKTKFETLGHTRFDMKSVTATVPIAMDGLRRQSLRESFRIAGLEVEAFVTEPLAGLLACLREGYLKEFDLNAERRVLVIDWGGGTLDLTLCQVGRIQETGPFGIKQLLSDGTTFAHGVGGFEFDKAIVNFVTTKNAINQPSESDRNAWLIGAEKARKFFSSIDEPSYLMETPVGRIQVSREDLIQAGGIILDRAADFIGNFVHQIEAKGREIDFVLAIGGMSKYFDIKNWLFEKFGRRIQNFYANDGQIAVAKGASLISGLELPIRVADTIELRTKGTHSFSKIFTPGSALPKESIYSWTTNELYCTDASSGFARIQICAPTWLDSYSPLYAYRDRRELCTIDVPVSRDFELIRLRHGLDRNAIFTFHAGSATSPSVVEREVSSVNFEVEAPFLGSYP